MRLRLNGLEAPCIIGDLAWERTREQTLLADLELELGDSVSASDRLADTVDYVALAASVRAALREARCRMIEHAAKVVADTVLADPRVRAVRVSVTKRTPVPGLASATAVLSAFRPTSKKKGNSMLKGVSPVVSPDLLKVLAEMGHGDEIVFSDAHFPAHAFGRDGAIVLRADGLKADVLLKGLIPLFELDSYATPVVMMAAVPGDTLDPAVEKAYREALGYSGKIDLMERYAFYARAKKAYAVVLTGETRKYGNIILKKGVTPVAS